jgi:hypothetical protein
MVKSLIAAGADPNAVSGQSALMLASHSRGDAELLGLLLAHTPAEALDEADARGFSALGHAVLGANAAAVSALLARGADAWAARGGTTLLMDVVEAPGAGDEEEEAKHQDHDRRFAQCLSLLLDRVAEAGRRVNDSCSR